MLSDPGAQVGTDSTGGSGLLSEQSRHRCALQSPDILLIRSLRNCRSASSLIGVSENPPPQSLGRDARSRIRHALTSHSFFGSIAHCFDFTLRNASSGAAVATYEPRV